MRPTLVLALLALAAPAGAQDRPAGPVVITLAAEARADAGVVPLGKVARVDGGDPAVRAAVARLDVADLADAALVVTRDQVKYRLLLQGHRPDSFRLFGTTRTVVRPERPAAGPPPAEAPVLVKARDRVKMVVPLGPASVVATGEALQEGRLGQTIRVRNVDSNRTVQGRVVGRGQVEVGD